MELKKQTFRQNVQKSRAFTQITLDGDCIIKDNRPDLLKIIHTRGNIVFEDVKVSRQTVWVTGKLHFTVLYRSEDDRLESFSDSVEFGEKLFMDGIGETEPVSLTAQLEDLNISTINSRKVAVRALVGVTAVCEEAEEETVVCAAEGVQQKSTRQSVLALTESGHDMLRIHSDLTLPQSSPNIGKIIYENVEVHNREITCTEEGVRIQGEMYIAVLYSSDDGKMEWYETTAPFSEMASCKTPDTQPVCWVTCRPAEYEVAAAEDYDGEERALSVNLSMDVDIRLWEEQRIDLLTDVYSLDENLIPQREPFCVRSLLVKNDAKLRISEQMKLGGGQERILQLCSSEGRVEIDHTEVVENGLQVDGVLTVDLLYATVDDRFPIAHAQEQIPFTQVVDAPGVHDMQGISYELDPQIDRITVNLLDNERYEVKAVISVSALVMRNLCLEKIVDVAREPFDTMELMRQPGITGYIVRSDESLWDIARRHHTTEADIMETNGLKSAAVQPEMKLVIVKRVAEMVQ